MWTLLGIDIGSTTTSAIVATAQLSKSLPGGRSTLTELQEKIRTPLRFTPIRKGELDVEQLLGWVDEWLEGVDNLMGGGALITGLAARSSRAAELSDKLRERLGNALVATARDPRLESWLAFMGNVAMRSREFPDQWFLNLDIGGGTTNLALGRGGEVVRTGSLWIGGRHVQVEPGSFRILRMTEEARAFWTERGIAGLVERWIQILEDAVQGQANDLVETTMGWVEGIQPVIVFSGGVGELVYRLAAGDDFETPTPFGDLGVELAKGILASPLLSRDLRQWAPEGQGRAVVYGLLRHATNLSGSTLYLPHPEILPLRDVPVFASQNHPDLAAAIQLARQEGGAITLQLLDISVQSVRTAAEELLRLLGRQPFPTSRPLVILTARNVGKALGAYLSEWGRGPHRNGILVIDEISDPGASFLHVGQLRSGVLPVSFYGMR